MCCWPRTCIYVVLTGAFAIIAGSQACSPEQKHRVLTYFFDGVPPLGEAPRDEPAPQALLRRGRPAVRLGAAPGERRYRVRAHDALKCVLCHRPEYGMTIGVERDSLCVRCHENTFHDRAFVHGPAGLAQCGVCHVVHWSKVPSLLTMEERPLCRSCHSQPDLMEPEYHRGHEAEKCSHCHDPHGADNRFFLRPIAQASTQPASSPGVTN